MTDFLFELPESKGSTLQARIQEMLVNTILAGHISPDTPLPSGRKLSLQLGVARNTVVLAYQHLVDNGFLISRERSGYYVNPEILLGRSQAIHLKSEDAAEKAATQAPALRVRVYPSRERVIKKPADWQKYRYPFVYGQYDKELFPVADWRECCRDATSISSLHASAGDMVDRDNPELVDQIQSKLLPRRGVWAKSDEILVTMGAQQAIFIAAQLLLDNRDTVGIENPGYTDARNIFHLFTDRIALFNVDREGLIPDQRLNDCTCLYITPSHQFPTTVTMSKQRRIALLALAEKSGLMLLEDDYECELNFRNNPTPALKSLDQSNRVIYIGSLSKTLAPGFRVGYIVASSEFIREARALRRLMIRHPPTNNQHIVAQFLKRGYHDALVRRLTHLLQERWEKISSVIDSRYPAEIHLPLFGGSSFWLQLQEEIDTRELLNRTRTKGVLFEPGNIFFSRGDSIPYNFLRLGFSSIAPERIPEGLGILAAAIGDY